MTVVYHHKLHFLDVLNIASLWGYFSKTSNMFCFWYNHYKWLSSFHTSGSDRWTKEKRLGANSTLSQTGEEGTPSGLPVFEVQTYYHTNLLDYIFVENSHYGQNSKGKTSQRWMHSTNTPFVQREFCSIESTVRRHTDSRQWESFSLSDSKVANVFWLRERSLQMLLSAATHLMDRSLSQT